MKAEEYFFIYAYPCAEVLKDLGFINGKTLEYINKKRKENEAISKEELEKIFKEAFRRIKIIAKEMNKDYWDKEVIKEYFLKRHNEFIDNNDGYYANLGDTIKELCKVNIGKVTAIKDNILTVNYNNKERKIVNETLKLNIGDKVSFHFGFAVEKFQ